MDARLASLSTDARVALRTETGKRWTYGALYVANDTSGACDASGSPPPAPLMPSGAARDRQPTRQPTEIRHEIPLEIPHGIPHEIPLEIPHGIPALMGAFSPRETRRISDLTLTLGEFRSSSIYQAVRYISDLPTTERPRGDKHGPPRGTDVGLSTMTKIMRVLQGARKSNRAS